MQTLEELHTFFEETVDPRVRVVAVNFANTMKPVFDGEKLDGVITEIDDTRSITAPELIGKALGAEVGKNLSEKRGSPITVSVAGDGLCQVLAGKTFSYGDSIAFGVVGTGYNMGFLLDSETFVNLDAASF